ncbi:MAG: hypothetical protein ACOX1G_08130 [bacterium]|jgi:hypothetical protein
MNKIIHITVKAGIMLVLLGAWPAAKAFAAQDNSPIPMKALYSTETVSYIAQQKGYKITAPDGRVLEYSPDYSPIAARGGAAAVIAQNAIGRKRSLGEGEYLYGGEGFIYIRYPVKDVDDKVTGNITIDIRTGQVADGGLVPGKPYSGPLLGIRQANERVIDGISSQPYVLTEGTTSAVALIDYWQSHGAGWIDQGKSQKELALALSGASCGCDLNKLLATYIDKAGYTAHIRHQVWPAKNGAEEATLIDYMTEIDSGNPGLLVLSSCGQKRIYVAAGYRIDSQGSFIVIKDQGTKNARVHDGYIYLRWDGQYDGMEITSLGRPVRKTARSK